MYNRYYPYLYNRSKSQPKPAPPANIIPNPPPQKKPPQKNPQKKPQKKKFDFKSFKKNTCTSLNDVECFLNNFSHTLKYIKLIKLLK